MVSGTSVGAAVGAAVATTTSVVKNVVFKFANDWSMNLASMIAYNLITAIFPILLAVLSLVGLVLRLTAYGHIQDVAAAIGRVFPREITQSIDLTALLQSLIGLTGLLAVASLVGLLWLGSNLFSNIENAFSIIFRIRGRDLVPQRLMAIGMVLLLALLLPLSLGAASLVTAGSDWFDRLVPKGVGVVLSYVGPLTSLGVLWLLFLAIYLVVPNFEVRVRQAWRGALVAALLVGLLELLFPLYFRLFLSPNTRYGVAAAALLVVIIWFWFFAVITVVGAQINAVCMGLTATTFDLSRTFELAYAQQDPDVDQKRKTTPTRFKRRVVTGLLQWLRRTPKIDERP
jgi:membrane protein